ncbi:MAG: hypothetical protein SF182_30615 [Deltaproteobacteria bacterium]|nr:hypothetical protein [Deltaproteobacteria bacterium]
MSTPRPPKMMIGFVVRRCAVELGRMPTAHEFAAWANAGDARPAHVFGRPISIAEAQLILRHQARLVSARSASAEEAWIDGEAEALVGATPGPNVVRLADVRARRTGR